SLSSCEQFALFGSVRKTLMSNSEWKIKDVRFTERGEDIVL
ncbi:MAG: sporulation/spore germination protein, partial [Dolichospermum sp.]